MVEDMKKRMEERRKEREAKKKKLEEEEKKLEEEKEKKKKEIKEKKPRQTESKSKSNIEELQKEINQLKKDKINITNQLTESKSKYFKDIQTLNEQISELSKPCSFEIDINGWNYTVFGDVPLKLNLDNEKLIKEYIDKEFETRTGLKEPYIIDKRDEDKVMDLLTQKLLIEEAKGNKSSIYKAIEDWLRRRTGNLMNYKVTDPITNQEKTVRLRKPYGTFKNQSVEAMIRVILEYYHDEKFEHFLQEIEIAILEAVKKYIRDIVKTLPKENKK